MWGDGWGSWIVGVLMMALFWGGLGVIVFLALRGWNPNQGPDATTADHRDARAILEERFASGEISEDEFEERRRVLERGIR